MRHWQYVFPRRGFSRITKMEQNVLQYKIRKSYYIANLKGGQNFVQMKWNLLGGYQRLGWLRWELPVFRLH